jgi:hypothetical protein
MAEKRDVLTLMVLEKADRSALVKGLHLDVG